MRTVTEVNHYGRGSSDNAQLLTFGTAFQMDQSDLHNQSFIASTFEEERPCSK